MKEIAPGLHQLKGFPPNAINVYLSGDVLIDASIRQLAGWIKSQIEDRPLALVALTHVHADHFGAAHAVCEARHVPLACHRDDVDAMEGRTPVPRGPDANRVLDLIERLGGPPHPVGRVLEDGDQVGEFRVVHAPGHSPGEVIYFRDSDRVAICGDVIRTMNLITMLPEVGEPPDIFTFDKAANRRAIKQLAELEPTLVCPGHGPPLRDIAKLEALASKL